MAGFSVVDRTSTLLTGKAAYTTVISCNEDIAELYEPSVFHEIELKVDDNGLHRMDIYSPRTLVNSIPLHGEVVPIGELSNFQLLKSNIRGNVLCVIHQTSNGPKHEFFIFKRRDEMQVWIDRLNETLFPCTKRLIRRSTEPTSSNAKSTEGNDKADSTIENCLYEGSTCIDLVRDFSESNCESSSSGSSSSSLSSQTVTCDSSVNSTIQLTPSVTIDDVLQLKAAETSKNKFMTDKCIKTPVEDVYVFKDEAEDCHLNEHVCARQRSIPNPGDEVHKDYMLLHSETNLCEQRIRTSMTVFKADANLQQERQRKLVHRVEETHPRDMLRQLLDEVGRGPITMIISLEEAIGLKFFEDRGKFWVKNCGSCEGIYAGDSLIKINGHEVCNVDVCRNILDIFGDSEEIQITIERLPRADLQLITPLKNGEIPFTVEGTKIKTVYVDHDEGLFESAKQGNGYITHVNGDYVSFSSTTLEVNALLQDFKDEFLLILHQRGFSEMLE